MGSVPARYTVHAKTGIDAFIPERVNQVLTIGIISNQNNRSSAHSQAYTSHSHIGRAAADHRLVQARRFQYDTRLAGLRGAVNR